MIYDVGRKLPGAFSHIRNRTHPPRYQGDRDVDLLRAEVEDLCDFELVEEPDPLFCHKHPDAG